MKDQKPFLVTGAAGFLGFHVSRRLLDRGDTVVGLDNVNEYYDVNLKWDRLKILEGYPGFQFLRIDLQDRAAVDSVLDEHRFETIIHLAAQAGVRYSLTNPHAYVESNVHGFLNVLEGCRRYGVKHLLFASSSSVYGAHTNAPFSIHQTVDHPVSIYAATKKANELMAHTYAYLYGIPSTGLRFFTVYGPWGRPDMALFLFTRAILAGKPIQVFNHGQMVRDFTYVDDVVEMVLRIMDTPARPNPDWNSASPDPGTSSAPYRIYNIGNNRPVLLMDFIRAIEKCLGISARLELLPMQPGDVPATCADIDDLLTDFHCAPKIPSRWVFQDSSNGIATITPARSSRWAGSCRGIPSGGLPDGDKMLLHGQSSSGGIQDVQSAGHEIVVEDTLVEGAAFRRQPMTEPMHQKRSLRVNEFGQVHFDPARIGTSGDLHHIAVFQPHLFSGRLCQPEGVGGHEFVEDRVVHGMALGMYRTSSESYAERTFHHSFGRPIGFQ